MLGRRKFLGTLTAGMAATLVPAGVIRAAGLATLRERFAGLVDDDFHLTDSAGAVTNARLVAMHDGPDCPGLEQYSILLEGSDLAEGLYRIYHPLTGGVEIGLVQSRGPGAVPARQRAYFTNFV